MIAAEQFVRTLAGKHDLDLFAGKVGEKIERNRRRIGQGFIHVILDGGGDVKIFFCGDFLRVIAHAFGFCKLLGGGKFGIFFFRIADGKGFHVVALRHFVHHIA